MSTAYINPTECDIYTYIKSTIVDFKEKERVALDYIELMKCDLDSALPRFCQEIEEKIEEWCDANEEDTENYYVDDIFWDC